jgi:hypothetical protein
LFAARLDAADLRARYAEERQAPARGLEKRLDSNRIGPASEQGGTSCGLLKVALSDEKVLAVNERNNLTGSDAITFDDGKSLDPTIRPWRNESNVSGVEFNLRRNLEPCIRQTWCTYPNLLHLDLSGSHCGFGERYWLDSAVFTVFIGRLRVCFLCGFLGVPTLIQQDHRSRSNA